MEKQFLRFSSGSGMLSGLAIFILLSLFSLSSMAQGVGINTSGAPGDTSAMLDVKSTTKGLLIPRMTTAQRNAIILPANGLLVYNTDCNNLNYNAGTPTAPNWIQVNINNTIASPGAISGPSAVCLNQSGVTYSIAPVPGASAYTWTVPSGAVISSGQNTTAITVDFGTSTGTICVTAGNYCGTSSATCLSVTFSAAPSVTTNPSAAVICENGNTGFSVAASGAGLSYQWQENNGSWSNLTNGGVFSNVTTANLSITAATSGMNGRQYKCIVSGTCNPSPAISAAASLTVNALPSSAFTWSPANPATNQSCTFTPTVSGATYSWTFQNGTPATSTAQNPAVSWATSGTYSVGLVVSQNGCTSATTTNSITVVFASCVHGSQTFSANGSYNTGSVQTFTVPSNACDPVTIEVWGAQGGNTSQAGGKGARMKGDFTGLAGVSLSIIVGQQGESRSSYDGGGGGGTFVWRTATSAPLIIAGGGGGGGGGNGSAWAGIDAVTANNGTNGNAASQGAGVNGNGGTAATGSYWASGGSGWYSVGNVGNGCSNTSSGGSTPLSGGAGGTYGGDYGYNGYGGYGGGGGAQGACNCAGGGGGGGYSGGGPGANCGGGGGGGSYNNGTNQSNSAGIRTGNGQVIITW